MLSHRRRPRFATATLLVSTVALLGGCARSSAFDHSAFVNDPTMLESRDGGITLSVVNRNFEDVRVYMLRGTSQMYVGTVGGLQTRYIRIPTARIGSSNVLSLAMVTVPSRARISMIPLNVEPGQIVEARVGTHVQNSSVYIRVPGSDL